MSIRFYCRYIGSIFFDFLIIFKFFKFKRSKKSSKKDLPINFKVYECPPRGWEIPGLRNPWSNFCAFLSLEHVAACEAHYCSNIEVNSCLKIVLNGVLVQNLFFFDAQVLLNSEINYIIYLLLMFFVQFCSWYTWPLRVRDPVQIARYFRPWNYTKYHYNE